MNKTLVVFYTFSKTTKMLAEQIAIQTGGALRELIPEKPYTFDYNTAVKEARIEIERGYCPKLISEVEAIDSYTNIFIGTPNWFKSFAPPILTFLKNVNLSGKTVIPFCTHGGGGFGNIEYNIAKECPNSKILEGFAAMSNFEPHQVTDWLKEIDLIN